MNNLKLEKIIHNSLQTNHISHCYLLKGYEEVDFTKSILFIINSLNNSNLESLATEQLPPNIKIFDKFNENASLSKSDLVTEFQNSTLASFQTNERKFYVIQGIDQASSAALNALLKTIEEPSPNVIFIFTTTKISRVPITIQSRSLVISVPKESPKEILEKLLNLNYEQKKAEYLAHIFPSLTYILTNVTDETWWHIRELEKQFLDSFKNFSVLYTYLAKFIKKDTKQIFINLLYALKFFYAQKWNLEKYKNEQLKALALAVRKTKFDAYACYIELSEFLDNKNENYNFFLQVEKMLIALSEYYE
ncbi:hypothetical protein [Mycoplasmopsis columbinasalis]|uniref:DNA polymerase III subunit delta n=1 Tax=Mycoplasmopsis columbinasalis TaxID=114880 RepID=A0A449BB41_9BACT|nr:hypothetical protein [Mycoplasmopsis columbinasalis]VEU78410.1 DNA polymerase III subunit delta' [Mycoplasmopsis columbinasalis]